LVTCVWLSVALALLGGVTPAQEAPPTKILILVGPSNHPPGTHEVAAGARLVKHCLERAENVRGLAVEIVTAWPTDRQSLQKVAAILFTGDRFPPAEMPDRERIMADLATMMDHGCGLVCIHYATGLNATQVAADGDHPLLRWMGGYFATRCLHHQSIARVFAEATIEPNRSEPAAKDHAVLRGWKTFTVHDEPYIKNYFGTNGLEKNVTALATSQLPPEAPQRETVAWAVSRADGGRGVGIVMPHFYKNWQVDDLRMLIMNAIVWSARREVPADGVKTNSPDLAAFEPAAIEPLPRPGGKQRESCGCRGGAWNGNGGAGVN
jgi:type 1 glutamine amidotransferase